VTWYVFKKFLIAVGLIGIFYLIYSKAQADELSPNPIKFGGFVDTYYLSDFNRPVTPDRPYATSAVRDSEFNLNLAFIEAKFEKEKVHGRLALQAGTSVQANYAAEPIQGTNSGSSLSRNIQEAYVGYQAADNLWVDAGIYASHIGFESFISRDNWTYTRSLGAEFTPYYQSGVRTTYQPSKEWTLHLHVMNGWGTISETNKDKSLGAQIGYSPSETWTFTYNNYYGNDIGEKVFHQLITKFVASSFWQFSLSLDYGQLRSLQTASWNPWQVQTLLAKYQCSAKTSLNGRMEHMTDKNYAIATAPSYITPTNNGFDVWGESLGVDVQLDPSLLWRTEVRAFSAKDPAFQTSNGVSNTDTLGVMSLALTL